MTDVQVVTTTTTTTNQTITDTFELPSLELPYNYSLLINKLEQLALAQLDLTFENFSLSGTGISNNFDEELDRTIQENVANEIFGQPIASGRAPPPRATHAHGGIDDGDYTRVMSDIWIGVILTLLIVSVVFFICSCFLYHKFQQWKNSYRTNQNEPLDICRRCPTEFEVESLPSYTIVSGLPTYDDALEEFRKAGIILTATPMPMMKLFEKDSSKDFYTLDSVVCGVDNLAVPTSLHGDTISLRSFCTCGANGNNNNNNSSSGSSSSTSSTSTATMTTTLTPTPTPNNSTTNLSPLTIELTPDQLAILTRKRLSLQIAFGSMAPSPSSTPSSRRNSRPRVDLYREVVQRNNLLKRSRDCNGPLAGGDNNSTMPAIHRTTSSMSLTTELGGHSNVRGHQQLHYHPHHRGSLC